MKLKSFKEFLSEMSYDNITYVPPRDKEFYKNFSDPFMKLVKDGINSEHYKLYRYGNGLFFLADENDKYLGFIDGDFNPKGGKYYVTLSGSSLSGSFYNLMFTAILAFTDVKEIISDNSLSTSVKKAYNNLNNKSQLNVRVLTPEGEYLPFSIETMDSNVSNRAIVTETHNFDILEKFESAFKSPSIYKLYINRDPLFNNRLYCESHVY